MEAREVPQEAEEGLPLEEEAVREAGVSREGEVVDSVLDEGEAHQEDLAEEEVRFGKNSVTSDFQAFWLVLYAVAFFEGMDCRRMASSVNHVSNSVAVLPPSAFCSFILPACLSSI